VIGKIFLSIMSLFCSLLVLEAGMRCVPEVHQKTVSDRPPLYFYPDGIVGGRDFSYPEAKPKGTFRIMVVGDSFTFGPELQFDDVFPKRLERLLGYNSAHRPVEVINYSKPGFSSADEISLVDRATSQFSPDLIILQITLNDPEMQPYRVTHPPQEPSFLERHSRLYRFIGSRLATYRSRQQYAAYYHKLFSEPATFGRFQASLQHIATLCRQRHVRVAMVLFPLFSHSFDQNYPFAGEHKRIGEIAKSLRVPYLDLFHRYEGLVPERLQIRPGQDSHPNEIAHRIAAEGIYEWLGKRHLVPGALTKVISRKQRLQIVHPFGIQWRPPAQSK
jgi:lysophospholipase L1-like esterase